MKLHLSEAGTPDLFVQAADSTWCPAYQVRDRIVDGVYRTTIYVHHPDGVAVVTVDRLAELAAGGRVMAPSLLGTLPVIAVVDDEGFDAEPEAEPVERRAADRPARQSRRAALLDEGTGSGPGGASRWERMRRLLNARCGQLEKHTGEDADDTRHRAAAYASRGRTPSSMDLTDEEMEQAVSLVEHELYEAGFDLDAADEEYRRRRLTSATGA